MSSAWTVEQVLALAPDSSSASARQGLGTRGKPRAVVCIAGERNGPPEDCGGIYGYQDILRLKKNPPSPNDENAEDDLERLEWVGDWQPDDFHLGVINQDLGRIRVKKAFVS